MPFWGSPTWLLPTASRRLPGSCRSHPNWAPLGFKTKDVLKDSRMNESHVTSQNVPPALRIWPRKGGARRPLLRPLCPDRSTLKTFAEWNPTTECHLRFCIRDNPKNIIRRNHTRCRRSRQSQLRAVWSFSTLPKCNFQELKPIVQQHFPAKTLAKWCLFEVHPPGFSQLLPGVCWDLEAKIQVKILPVSRKKKFSKTVTCHNSECSSSAAHVDKERRSCSGLHGGVSLQKRRPNWAERRCLAPVQRLVQASVQPATQAWNLQQGGSCNKRTLKLGHSGEHSNKLFRQNLHRSTGSLTDGHRPTPRSLVLLRFSAKLAKRAVEAAPRRLPGSCRSHPNWAPLGFKTKEILKDSRMNESHVTTQNVPPALRIWPRKGGARRPLLRPLCPDRSTLKTFAEWNPTTECHLRFCIRDNPKNIIWRNHTRCRRSRQSQLRAVWSFSTLPKCNFQELKPIVQQHFPAKTLAKWCLFEVHPPGFSQLLPGVCWDLEAKIQVKILPVSRQKKFSKTVTRHNSECSSSAAHLAKERRSTAAPSAPFVSRLKHLQNRENSVCF